MEIEFTSNVILLRQRENIENFAFFSFFVALLKTEKINKYTGKGQQNNYGNNS